MARSAGAAHNRSWLAAVVAAVLLVTAGGVIGVVLARRSGDKGESLSAGAVRTGDYRTGKAPKRVTMMVPNAQLQLQVTFASTASDDTGARTVHAPRGGVLVLLSWSSQPSVGKTSGFVDSRPSVLRLRGSGTSVTVDRALRPDQHTVGSDSGTPELVALPVAPAQVELEVSFAGREQTLRPWSGTRVTGAFAPLYRATGWSAGHGRVTDDQHLADATQRLRCFAGTDQGTAYRTPYLSELGWSPAGTEWLVLANVGFTRFDQVCDWGSGGHEVSYVPGKAQLSVTVGGKRPDKVLAPAEPKESDDAVVHAWGVFVFVIPRGAAVTVRNSATMPVSRSASGAGTAAPAHGTLRLIGTARYAVPRS